MREIDEDSMKADLLTFDSQCETMIQWCIAVLTAQQTIEPEREKGKWIDPGYDSIFTYVESYAKCDQCSKVVNYGREMNFCPNCGSDMRGNQDD